MKKSFKWFKGLSAAGKVGVIIAALLCVSVVNAATGDNGQNNKSNATVSEKAPSDVVTHKQVVKTSSIPYETVKQDDSSLTKGKTKVLTIGVEGEQSTTYDVTYTNGVETARSKISQKVTSKPINEVIAVGTYVAPQPDCPNGTYINSSGDTVCRPYESNSAPSGATAQCVDGTYSFSQHHSGTCSHHGGVAAWL